MIEWIEGSTARDKEIGIEPPCDGSPNCAGAIHIRSIDQQAWFEFHMTRAEIKEVRRLLIGLLKGEST